MVLGNYRDLFAAIAGSAAALTGLLFVAMSVAAHARRGVIQQVRAAAALLAFTNALSVSLFGLVPNNNIGYPALVVAVIGILFTLAGLRSILGDPVGRLRVRGQIGLIVLLLATFGFELAAGIVLLGNENSTEGIDMVGNVLAASLVIGIARSWELVGDRDTGIMASIAALAGREHRLSEKTAPPADRPDSPARDAPGRGAELSPPQAERAQLPPTER